MTYTTIVPIQILGFIKSATTIGQSGMPTVVLKLLLFIVYDINECNFRRGQRETIYAIESILGFRSCFAKWPSLCTRKGEYEKNILSVCLSVCNCVTKHKICWLGAFEMYSFYEPKKRKQHFLSAVFAAYVESIPDNLLADCQLDFHFSGQERYTYPSRSMALFL